VVILAQLNRIHGMLAQPWQLQCFAVVFRVKLASCWGSVSGVYVSGCCTALQVNDARTAAREAEWKLSAAENKATKVRASKGAACSALNNKLHA
jgi:outer membrane murein-binding lipoprotein Lpp